MKEVKRADAILILVALTISLCLILLRYTPSDTKTARVYENGKLTHVIDLSNTERVDIIEINGGALEVKDGTVRYVHSDCPDKLCEKFGRLAENGDTASCVPNKTVVTVTAEKSKDTADIMTY